MERKQERAVGANGELTTREMYRRAISVAWPAVLESFFISLAGMIDTMMVATMGSYAVAAVGLTAQPKFIALTVFFAINVAVSALVARRKGEQDRESANETFLTAFIMAMTACVVITAVFLIFTPQLMRLAGSNEDTHASAVTYFRVIIGGTVFNVISMTINSAQRGSGNTRISMTTNVVSSIVNIVFNYLLIGGKFGFPKLGVFGAALATVLGTVAAAGMSIASLYRKKSYVSIPFIIQKRVRARMRDIRLIVHLAANMIVENLAMRVGFVATALMAARLGTDVFAAHNIGMNLLGLTFSFADGMQVAGVALAGEALGAGKKEDARQYGSICQRIGFFISLGLSVFLLLGGRWFFGLYFPDAPHILDYGVLICRFMTVICILQISQIIFGACLRAAGDVRYALVSSLISCTLIRTGVTILCVQVLGLGLTGIWLGILGDQIMRFIFMSLRFKAGKWVDIKL